MFHLSRSSSPLFRALLGPWPKERGRGRVVFLFPYLT
jgi:hypothetical protein